MVPVHIRCPGREKIDERVIGLFVKPHSGLSLPNWAQVRVSGRLLWSM